MFVDMYFVNGKKCIHVCKVSIIQYWNIAHQMLNMSNSHCCFFVFFSLICYLDPAYVRL